MQRNRSLKGFQYLVFLCMAFIAFVCVFQNVCCAGDIRKNVMADGVEYWHRDRDGDKKPWFFRQMENILNVVLSDTGELPFDKSVAFLVGVSKYEHLSPQLGFVKNDLEALRDFLLNQGGFDAVYMAADEVATESLIKGYMRNRFRKSLNKKDRLLFYYSGHGADLGGSTGYIQLSEARPDDFATHVLRIDECEEWSRIIPAGHILFIYDCCVSGLAFTAKSGNADDYRQLLSTLSGNGSRTVITAGTAEEKTFGVGNHSVFTKAFLDALRDAEKSASGFMTLSQIFAQTEISVKDFAYRHKKKLTPRRWELEEDRYRGTFVFVDPKARNVKLSKEVRESLQIISKGHLVAEFGIILLKSFVTGAVYIDGRDMGSIKKGESREYDQPVGKHEVEVRNGGQRVRETVEVVKGRESRVRIRPISPPVTTTTMSGTVSRATTSTTVPKPPDPDKPDETRLTVESDVGHAVVEINGRDYGKVPREFTITEAGSYRIRVTAKGYQPYAKSLTLELGQSRTVKAHLEKEDSPGPDRDITNTLGMKFVLIPPGNFKRNGALVKISKGYYMQTTEVTQGQWKAVMGENPSYLKNCGDDCPVENVSWNNVQEFIKKLNRKEGTVKYRLPTEAEWEYACRAGTSTAYSWGNKADCSKANYGNGWSDECKGTNPGKTMKVASFDSNAWGLYDMHGNVWEWCEDWYGNYPSGSVTDPVGPSSAAARVKRGGSWRFSAEYCRSDIRYSYSPDDWYDYLGFRLALSQGQ